MMQELVYTSAPKGLKVGSSGYCTVASTPGMSAALAQMLEGISAYRHVVPPTGSASSSNPTIYAHRLVTLGGKQLHILSRIADAGLDYSGRSNKIAHHMVIDATGPLAAGPAWYLAREDFWFTRWEGPPQSLPVRTLPPATQEASFPETWHKVTGDAGWAGALVESAQSKRPCVVVVDPTTDSLRMVLEALALVAPEKRWQVGFSTYLSGSASDDCLWRFVLAGSPEAMAAKRNSQLVVIDTTQPLGAATGAYAESARRGAAHVTATVMAPRKAMVPPVPTRTSSSSGKSVARGQHRADEELRLAPPILPSARPGSTASQNNVSTAASGRFGIPNFVWLGVVVLVAALMFGTGMLAMYGLNRPVEVAKAVESDSPDESQIDADVGPSRTRGDQSPDPSPPDPSPPDPSPPDPSPPDPSPPDPSPPDPSPPDPSPPDPSTTEPLNESAKDPKAILAKFQRIRDEQHGFELPAFNPWGTEHELAKLVLSQQDLSQVVFELVPYEHGPKLTLRRNSERPSVLQFSKPDDEIVAEMTFVEDVKELMWTFAWKTQTPGDFGPALRRAVIEVSVNSSADQDVVEFAMTAPIHLEKSIKLSELLKQQRNLFENYAKSLRRQLSNQNEDEKYYLWHSDRESNSLSLTITQASLFDKKQSTAANENSGTRVSLPIPEYLVIRYFKTEITPGHNETDEQRKEREQQASANKKYLLDLFKREGSINIEIHNNRTLTASIILPQEMHVTKRHQKPRNLLLAVHLLSLRGVSHNAETIKQLFKSDAPDNLRKAISELTVSLTIHREVGGHRVLFFQTKD